MVFSMRDLMERISMEVTDYHRGEKTVAYSATVKINFPEYRDVYHPLFSGQTITVAVDLSKIWKNPYAGAVVLSPRGSMGYHFMPWLEQKTSSLFMKQFYTALFKAIDLEHGEGIAS